MHGGVAQGVGGALYERMVYDESGQLLNASFMDFLMPYASEVPHIETDHLETPSPLNPLGIKGAGEAGCIPVTAVIASAIEDAEGFAITSMPISPCELWELRRRHAGRRDPCPAAQPRDATTQEAPDEDHRHRHARPPRPQQVWDAFHDPAVLARCLPGCESLTAGGPGRVRHDRHRRGRGDQGHVRRQGRAARPAAPRAVHHEGHRRRRRRARSTPTSSCASPARPPGAPTSTYDADASVGGVIGGVGQRMLAGSHQEDGGPVLRGRRRGHRRRAPRTAIEPPVLTRAQAPGTGGRLCGVAATPAAAGRAAAGRGGPQLRARRAHRRGSSPSPALSSGGRSEATLMRAFTAAAVQVAPVPGPLSPESVAPTSTSASTSPAVRRRHRRRARRPARDGDDRLHPRLLRRGAVGPGLGDARPRHRAGRSRSPATSASMSASAPTSAGPSAASSTTRRCSSTARGERASASTARPTRSAPSTSTAAAG